MIIVRKGVNAGQLFYQDKFKKSIIAEDAIPIRFKDKYKDRIDIHWFIREYGQVFRKTAIGKFSSGTFSNVLLWKMKFKIPAKSFQIECSEYYQVVDNKVLSIKKSIAKLESNLCLLENSTII